MFSKTKAYMSLCPKKTHIWFHQLPSHSTWLEILRGVNRAYTCSTPFFPAIRVLKNYSFEEQTAVWRGAVLFLPELEDCGTADGSARMCGFLVLSSSARCVLRVENGYRTWRVLATVNLNPKRTRLEFPSRRPTWGQQFNSSLSDPSEPEISGQKWNKERNSYQLQATDLFRRKQYLPKSRWMRIM